MSSRLTDIYIYSKIKFRKLVGCLEMQKNGISPEQDIVNEIKKMMEHSDGTF